MSMWYTREEVLRRFSFFFNSSTLAGAFGGLLASAIEKMQGLRGYSGWRWIFILEGLLTIVLAFLSYFMIVDFPEDATWLTEDEREFMQARLMNDSNEKREPSSMKAGLCAHFKDYKSYLVALLFFGKLSSLLMGILTRSCNRGKHSSIQPHLLPTDHRPRLQILRNFHTATLRSAICSRLCILPYHIIRFRQSPAPPSFYPFPATSRISRRRHPTKRPQQRPSRVCGRLSRRHGRFWSDADCTLLVYHEPRRAL